MEIALAFIIFIIMAIAFYFLNESHKRYAMRKAIEEVRAFKAMRARSQAKRPH